MEANLAVVIVLIVAVVIIGLAIMRKKAGGRPIPAALRKGEQLPEFTAVSEDGTPLSSTSLKGAPAVILFVRGNWCPFCSRQVADLTRHYKAINEHGARLVLITPKPLETTRRVAEFFEFDFEFWLDEDLAITRQLGLVQSGGVPSDYRPEYGEDTIWPMALVVDAGGIIRYASISKLIADRPNPQKFVGALEAIG